MLIVKETETMLLSELRALKERNEQLETEMSALGRENEALRKDIEDMQGSCLNSALLTETAAILLENDNPQTAVDLLCQKVLAFLKCDAFFNYIVDYEQRRLHLNACGGIPDDAVQKMEWLDYGVGLCGCSARDGQRLVVENLQDTEDQYTALVRPFGIQAYACHPLISQGQILGTLSFCTRTRLRFRNEELFVMKAVADQVAIAMDRVLSYQRISQSEKKFREIFENASDAIFLLKEDLSIFDCNPAAEEILKCDKSRIVGQTTLAFSPPLQDDGVSSERKLTELLNLVLRNRPQSFEWLFRRPNSMQFEASVVANTFRMNGRPAILCIARDITERKTMERDFLQAQKMEIVGRLASGIAHDYNNIIMAIKGYVGILLPRMDAAREDVHYMKRIEALAKRAGNLTQQLLAFGRNKVALPKPNDLNYIVRKMKIILRWLVGDGLEFRMSLSKEPLVIMAVAGQIEQLLVNIVVNARDATPKGGLIRVSTSFSKTDGPRGSKEDSCAVHGYALLSISDNGTGMNEATKQKIFEPFFTMKEVGKGTGLGLSVVYTLVRNHGGSISVDSSEAVGTTFNIRFPLLHEVQSDKNG
ncbi:MAG: ATP-binding protein [Geobacteraceae bacterium]|nr:ATP-binding protein [Geobacteraceae bacterium]